MSYLMCHLLHNFIVYDFITYGFVHVLVDGMCKLIIACWLMSVFHMEFLFLFHGEFISLSSWLWFLLHDLVFIKNKDWIRWVRPMNLNNQAQSTIHPRFLPIWQWTDIFCLTTVSIFIYLSHFHRQSFWTCHAFWTRGHHSLPTYYRCVQLDSFIAPPSCRAWSKRVTLLVRILRTECFSLVIGWSHTARIIACVVVLWPAITVRSPVNWRAGKRYRVLIDIRSALSWVTSVRIHTVCIAPSVSIQGKEWMLFEQFSVNIYQIGNAYF